MRALTLWSIFVGFVFLCIGLLLGWAWPTVIGVALLSFVLVVLGTFVFIGLNRPRR